MINILTPLDLFGSLITPRRPGEPLSDYRRRLLQVAGVMARRDYSDALWVRARQEELAGHVGMPVRLVPGAGDAQLLEEARRRRLTYDKLDTWSGPLVWPETGAPGRPYHYNEAAPAGSGVGAELYLEPYLDEATGELYAEPGFVLIEGVIYYVAAHLERIVMALPEGTTETAVIPFQIQSSHGHRIEVVSETSLRLLASDHEHTITRVPGGWVFDTGSTHTHELLPVEARGPCFVATGSAASPAAQSIDGSFTVPVLHLVGREVTTTDGKHTAWVDPYDYYAGRFVIAGEDHVHEVVPSEDGTHLVALAGSAGHSHQIELPELPESRLMVPVYVSDEGEPISHDPPAHGFALHVRTEKGWTVVSSPVPFGERLILAFDAGELAPVPAPPPGTTMGLGPALPVTHVHIARAEGARSGDPLRLLLRSEDRYTGAVAGASCTVRLDLYDASGAVAFTREVDFQTGADGLAEVVLPTPGGPQREGFLVFYAGGSFTNEHHVTLTPQVGAYIAGYGATPWGLDYGR